MPTKKSPKETETIFTEIVKASFKPKPKSKVKADKSPMKKDKK